MVTITSWLGYRPYAWPCTTNEVKLHLQVVDAQAQSKRQGCDRDRRDPALKCGSVWPPSILHGNPQAFWQVAVQRLAARLFHSHLEAHVDTVSHSVCVGIGFLYKRLIIRLV